MRLKLAAHKASLFRVTPALPDTSSITRAALNERTHKYTPSRCLQFRRISKPDRKTRIKNCSFILPSVCTDRRHAQLESWQKWPLGFGRFGWMIAFVRRRGNSAVEIAEFRTNCPYRFRAIASTAIALFVFNERGVLCALTAWARVVFTSRAVLIKMLITVPPINSPILIALNKTLRLRGRRPIHRRLEAQTAGLDAICAPAWWLIRPNGRIFRFDVITGLIRFWGSRYACCGYWVVGK